MESETNNCRKELEQLLEKLTKERPVAAQRSNQTITAVTVESQGEHELFMKMCAKYQQRN